MIQLKRQILNLIIIFSLILPLYSQKQRLSQQHNKYDYVEDKSYGTMVVNGEMVKIKGNPIVKKYGLGMNEYDEIRDVIEASLTAKGKATYIARMRSVLIIDHAEGHNRVIDILNALHENPYNIQIEVEYNDVRSFESMGIKIQTGPIIINDGKIRLPKNGRIDIDGRKDGQNKNTKMSLTVMSGGQAKLWAVKSELSQPFYNEYALIGRDRFGKKKVYRAAEALYEMRNVGTELFIKPTYMGNGIVKVEVLPLLTGVDKSGKTKKFEVQSVSTTITAAVGQRIHIGGNNEKMNKFFASLLQPTAIGKQKGSKVLDIYLTPHILQVGPQK